MAGTEVPLIRPEWPAPAAVHAVATTRLGGFSEGPFASLNLGDHVADDPAAVVRNRERLRAVAALQAPPAWLRQVHGNQVVAAEQVGDSTIADAAATSRAGVICAVLTADCLPLLVCDTAGRRVAAVHAGWRGLAGGIVEAAVADFTAHGMHSEDLLTWLGPAIGPAAYEVSDDVKKAFGAADGAAFTANTRGRWQLDLYRLARGRLEAAGITAIYGGHWCTASDEARFFSHRRDGPCGRQATLIWLAEEPASNRGSSAGASR
ncbi:MAG: peptidoglycan editing factor PgeF [Gammaproteobacteria bacterium]|nr:peptidoglycan editing factor PgeF [Gammaproteobacteria bacterium]